MYIVVLCRVVTEDTDSVFLRNVIVQLKDFTEQQPRKKTDIYILLF